jgi:hypothetical protein
VNKKFGKPPVDRVDAHVSLLGSLHLYTTDRHELLVEEIIQRPKKEQEEARSAWPEGGILNESWYSDGVHRVILAGVVVQSRWPDNRTEIRIDRSRVQRVVVFVVYFRNISITRTTRSGLMTGTFNTTEPASPVTAERIQKPSNPVWFGYGGYRQWQTLTA